MRNANRATGKKVDEINGFSVPRLFEKPGLEIFGTVKCANARRALARLAHKLRNREAVGGEAGLLNQFGETGICHRLNAAVSQTNIPKIFVA